jgi:pimeloyl-ACP methyl ester carboxylesterase
MTTVGRRRLATAPGVELDVTEAGPADGPVVLLLHGFPESAPFVAPPRDLVGRQDAILPNHLGSTIIPGAGHWVQQERPREFDEWLLQVLPQI